MEEIDLLGIVDVIQKLPRLSVPWWFEEFTALVMIPDVWAPGHDREKGGGQGVSTLYNWCVFHSLSYIQTFQFPGISCVEEKCKEHVQFHRELSGESQS